VGKLSILKKASNLENTWSDIISTNVCGKKTYDHLYANEEINPNTGESVHEAITGIEIISRKAMMHIYTCIKIPWHALAMFKKCWIFPHQTICHSWSSVSQCWAKPKISDFQDALLTCIIFNRVSNRHRYGKYFTTTQAPTHTNTHTEWLSSMDIKYSCISELLSFHLSKVYFNSTNTSWSAGNMGDLG
jgi:hypothetical protein